MTAQVTLEDAAMTALAVPLHYAGQGRNLAWAALAGAPGCVEMQHYPQHDLVDAASRSRYFYHAHATPEPGPEEHGHFHLFMHQGQAFHHLAALSLDALGRPLRWFTTNQWVTGERWASAAVWRPWLSGFEIRTRGRLAPITRWLTAMVRLHQQDLQQLLAMRDAVLERELAQRSRRAVFNDRRLHIMSQTPISLEARVQSLLAASSLSKEIEC